MCICIGKPAGYAIKEEILERCYDANPDGAGFCIEEDGKLVIKKGFFTFQSFMDAFKPYEGYQALIHFRIKTHGPIVEENCHPFSVTDDVAFIHNGIIPGVPNDEHKSDTRMFKEMYLRPLIQQYGTDILDNPAIKGMIEKFIGASKLVVMEKGKEGFRFFNKSMGNESKEGIWFSNYSWQEKKVYPVTTPKHQSYIDYWEKELDECKLPTPTTNVRKFQRNKEEVSKISVFRGDFSFGTIVRTTTAINTEKGTIPKGAVGEVERVYSNNQIDVDFYQEGKINGIYPYALEIIHEFSDETLKELGWMM